MMMVMITPFKIRMMMVLITMMTPLTIMGDDDDASNDDDKEDGDDAANPRQRLLGSDKNRLCNAASARSRVDGRGSAVLRQRGQRGFSQVMIPSANNVSHQAPAGREDAAVFVTHLPLVKCADGVGLCPGSAPC